MLITAGTNFAGQFVPTLGGQIARTIDPVRRKSYTDKNSPLPNSIQRMIGTARNKIPGPGAKERALPGCVGQGRTGKQPLAESV